MYLPFEDNWPTNLTPQTYHYAGHWPGKGESRDAITQHYLTAPYIGDALSHDYKDAFLAVEKQFIEHFAQKGWKRTEMQCFFGGKNTHRIDYGSNLWWTTDEPMHWDDWLALQFFDRLWTEGRGTADARHLGGPGRHLPAAVDGPDAGRRHQRGLLRGRRVRLAGQLPALPHDRGRGAAEADDLRQLQPRHRRATCAASPGC